MARKIVVTDSGPKRIRDISPGEWRIDPDFVAEALGAKVPGIAIGRGTGPLARFRLERIGWNAPPPTKPAGS